MQGPANFCLRQSNFVDLKEAIADMATKLNAVLSSDNQVCCKGDDISE